MSDLTPEIILSEANNVHYRLGSVEGKLDALLRLREADGANLRDTALEIKAAVSGIREEIRLTTVQVTELATEVRALKNDHVVINQLVRGGDAGSLVHRMATIEQSMHNLKNTVNANQLSALADMGELKAGLESDFKDLRTEIQEFARAAKTRDESIAHKAFLQTKDQKAFHRNLILAITGTVLTGIGSLITALLNGTITIHWK